MIKGGGGALLREKVLIRAAKKTVILASENKFSNILGEHQSVPVEILPFARSFIFNEIKKLEGKPSLRVDTKGYPFLTENGNLIIDTDFGLIYDPPELLAGIKNIPGVIEVGIFIEKIFRVYKAYENGIIELINP